MYTPHDKLDHHPGTGMKVLLFLVCVISLCQSRKKSTCERSLSRAAKGLKDATQGINSTHGVCPQLVVGVVDKHFLSLQGALESINSQSFLLTKNDLFFKKLETSRRPPPKKK
jgi:hypothetical protein